MPPIGPPIIDPASPNSGLEVPASDGIVVMLGWNARDNASCCPVAHPGRLLAVWLIILSP